MILRAEKLYCVGIVYSALRTLLSLWGCGHGFLLGLYVGRKYYPMGEPRSRAHHTQPGGGAAPGSFPEGQIEGNANPELPLG